MYEGTRTRRMVAVLLMGLLAFTQLGAAPEDRARGTASTSLVGVTLDVDAGTLGSVLGTLTGEDLLGTAVDVADVGTLASTDVTDRTGRDTPWAEVGVVPLRHDGQEHGAVKATSGNGTQQGDSQGAALGAATDPAAALGLSVSPFSVTASASAQQATAAVDTLVADVAALLQTIDLDVSIDEVSSVVDTVRAASGVSVEVTGLSLTLGDLLPVEVLSTLPLSTILDLLETLPVDLSAVQAEIDALRAAVDAVVAQLAAVNASGEAVGEAAAAFQPVVDGLLGLSSDVADISSSIATLNAHTGGTITGATVTDTVDDITDIVTGDPNPVGGVVGDVGGTVGGILDDTDGSTEQETSNQLAAVKTILAAIEDVVDRLADYDLSSLSSSDVQAAAIAVPAACSALPASDSLTSLSGHGTIITDMQACATALDATVDDAIEDARTIAAGSGIGLADEVDALAAAVALLEGLLDTVASAANDLTALLDDLLASLLGDAAATELLAVGGFTAGITAIASDSPDNSRATLTCTPVTATVLGTTHTTPSCADGLQAVAGVSTTIGEALASVQGVLRTLPLADVVSVGDLRLQVLGDLEESVTTDDAYTVATAQVELLELVVPALTVDPSGLTDLGLGDLGLPDVIATVQTVVNAAQKAVNELFAASPAGDPLKAVLSDAEALLTPGTGAVATALSTATTALDELLASLDGVGTLTSFTTPSLHLVVDPAASAEFAPGAAPAEDSGTPLPATGGGFVLLGLASIGGALLLARRRE